MVCRYSINRICNSETEKRIRMWRMERRAGNMYYVPLDKNLNPIADIALQDVQDNGKHGSLKPGNFVLVSGANGKTEVSDTDAERSGWFVGLIETVLRSGDATTYEVYEALILRLESSSLVQAVPSVGVDIEGILQENFWYYFAPAGVGGVLVKVWTLDEDMAKSHGQSRQEVAADFEPLLPFMISNN